MTIESLYVLAGSAIVIAFMLGVALLLGFRARLKLDETELRRLIAEADPGARVDAVLIDADGKTALARVSDGGFMVATAMGGGVTLRSFPAAAVRLRLKDGRVIATFADLGFPRISLKLAETSPPAWLAELAAGQGGGEKT